jgi:hypothetical protein
LQAEVAGAEQVFDAAAEFGVDRDATFGVDDGAAAIRQF